jgi:hypothetical protein
MKEEVKNTPKENVWYAFEKKFNQQLQAIVDENFDFYKKINNDKNIKDEMMKQMFISLYQNMRSQPQEGQPGL